jgi:hypothetical protein
MQSVYRRLVEAECPADDCEWWYVTTSYPDQVEAYHDHLREAHPRRWVRA